MRLGAFVNKKTRSIGRKTIPVNRARREVSQSDGRIGMSIYFALCVATVASTFLINP